MISKALDRVAEEIGRVMRWEENPVVQYASHEQQVARAVRSTLTPEVIAELAREQLTEAEKYWMQLNVPKSFHPAPFLRLMAGEETDV